MGNSLTVDHDSVQLGSNLGKCGEHKWRFSKAQQARDIRKLGFAVDRPFFDDAIVGSPPNYDAGNDVVGESIMRNVGAGDQVELSERFRGVDSGRKSLLECDCFLRRQIPGVEPS